MPIVNLDGKPTLICVNRHPEAVTMVRFDDEDGAEVGLLMLPAQKKLMRCRAFSCPTFGYLELYESRDP